VLELPVGLPLEDVGRMVLSAEHWKPLVNGYSGFTPTTFFFRSALLAFPSPDTIRLLDEIGVRWVVVHRDRVPTAHAVACDAATPHLVRTYRDATTCVLEVRGAPPAAPHPPDRPVALTGAVARASDGTDASAVLDARLDTHWAEAVGQTSESWLQLDLPAAHVVSRVVLELGPHFGEYLRLWRIETSLDGVTWQASASERNGMPPLAALRADPGRLTQDLRLPEATAARHVRVVRPGAAGGPPAFDLWNNWTRWGVHEIRLFEAVP
jgi:hypothetical protein